MSAVAAALAALFLFLVLRRLTARAASSRSRAPGSPPFTYYFWVSAVAAELYALHAAFVAALLLLVLRWREEAPSAHSSVSLALLFGLGAGNHLSMALLLPGFAWLAATGRRDAVAATSGCRSLAAACLAIAGAASISICRCAICSDTPLNYARDYWHVDLSTPDGLLWMVTARMFAPSSSALPIAAISRREALIYAAQLWSNFVGLGVVLGADRPVRRFPPAAVARTSAWRSSSPHTSPSISAYRVGDKELMLLPTYLIWAVWVGDRGTDPLPPARPAPAARLVAVRPGAACSAGGRESRC